MRHAYLTALLAVAALLVSACTSLPPAEVPAPAGPLRQMVVLDIDGTLTPRDLDVFEVRPGAAAVVQAYAAKGYALVYVTTRIPGLQTALPKWLATHGFPPGPLHVAQSADERADAAGFKAAVLSRYREAGWQLAYAYGDSGSDFEAYARVGIPAARVFALKRRFADSCVGERYAQCLDGWVDHLPYVEREVLPAR